MADWLQAASAIKTLLDTRFITPFLPIVHVFPGYPTPDVVHAELRASPPRTLVSIFPNAGSKLASRYGREPEVVTKTPSTIVPSISGLVVTFSGTITANDNVFVHINRRPFNYHVLAIDTLANVAAALATTINAAGFVASAVGNTIVLSGNIFNLHAAAHGSGLVYTEVSRIQRRVMLSVWAANAVDRNVVSDAAVETLAGAERLVFADLSKGRILYESSTVNDFGMPAGYLKEDSFWQVEYAIYLIETDPRVGDINCTLKPTIGGQLIFDAF